MLLTIVCAIVLCSFVNSTPTTTGSDNCNSNLNDLIIKWNKKPLGEQLETRLGDLTEPYKIKIVNQTIPVLCEKSFENFDNLFELVLSYNGIVDLQPNAFSGANKLSDLHLDGNKIEEINSGVFNNFRIVILRLQNNKIQKIQTDAFDNMPRLRILNLANNKINTVNGDWFKNTPMVHQLNLEDNLITTLSANSFKHLHGKQIINDNPAILNIDLSNNQISSIHPQAFDGLGELGMLSLDRNLLENLHEDTFSDLKTIKSVSFMHNKFSCLPILVHHILKADVTYLENNPWECKCVIKLDRQVKRKRLNVHLNYDVLKCKIDALSAIVKGVLDEHDDTSKEF